MRCIPAGLHTLALGALVGLLMPAAVAAAPQLLQRIQVSRGAGWSASLVPRTTADADTLAALSPSPVLLPTQPVYVNWLVTHNPSVQGFWTDQLLLDGEPLETYPRYNDLTAFRSWYALNRGPLWLRAGRHTLTGKCDIYVQTGEDYLDRGDNVRSEQYLWTPEPLALGQGLSRDPGPPARGGLLPNGDAYACANAIGVPWVVSARPADGADVDLLLYDDYADSEHGLTHERARSERQGDSTEFVVGTADALPLAVYPLVIRGLGSLGGYRVHHGDGQGRMDPDDEAYWGGEVLTGSEAARVYQVQLQAGHGYPISAWRAIGSSPLAFSVFAGGGGAIASSSQAIVRSHPVAGQDQAAAWFEPAESGPYLIVVYLDDMVGPAAEENRYRLAVGSQAVGVAGEGMTVELAGAAPNPAAGPTRLRFALGTAGRVTLAIYDVGGRRLRTLVDGVRAAGPGEARWDLADEAGRAVAPGIYWARCEAAGMVRATRIAVVR